MSQGRRRFGTLVAAVLAVVAASPWSAGCKDDDTPANEDRGFLVPDSRLFDFGPTGDAYECKRPPTINSCIFPPKSICPTKVLCLGCTCSGASAVFACDGWTKDCRDFCDGCYPQSYTACSNKAPKVIQGLCAECAKKGGCDRLPRRDAGAPDKKKK